MVSSRKLLCIDDMLPGLKSIGCKGCKTAGAGCVFALDRDNP